MSAHRLKALFESLSGEPREVGKLVGARIAGRPGDFLARGSDEQPVLLLAARVAEDFRPPIRLKHLAVQFGVNCRIQEPTSGLTEGMFVCVECISDEQLLTDFFLKSAEAVLEALPESPSTAEIQNCVATFVELFRRLSESSTRSIKGLWAELWTIANSGAPVEWVEGWHKDADEKFDFSFPGVRADVKASEQSQRIHEFSFDQLHPPEGTNGFIISLMVRRSGNGVGALKLAERVAAHLGARPDLSVKLWHNIAEALGADFCTELDVLFDEDFTRETATIYPTQEIPQPALPPSGEVFDVKFKARLHPRAGKASITLQTLTPAGLAHAH